MVKIKTLQHVGILVPDVEASAKWYISKSGFEKAGEFQTGGSRVIFVRNQASGVMFELIQRPERSADAMDVEKNGGRIDHIAFEVENLEMEFENAKKENMDIIEGIVDVPEFWENGFQYFLVYSAGREKVEYCKVLQEGGRKDE